MKKVLIASGFLVPAESMAKALRGEYEVHIHNDSSSIADVLECLRPDALIMELSCAYLDALATARRPRVILALTNYVDDHVIEQAASVGISEILLIPFSMAYLAKRLNYLLK